jgi:hypothetical protein
MKKYVAEVPDISLLGVRMVTVISDSLYKIDSHIRLIGKFNQIDTDLNGELVLTNRYHNPTIYIYDTENEDEYKKLKEIEKYSVFLN